MTTQPVTVGKLWTVATGYLTSPAGAPSSYEYDLAVVSPSGVIGPQRHVLTPAGLATVHADFYQDDRSTGAWTPAGVFDPGRAEAVFDLPFFDSFMIALPRAETQYFSAGPTLSWENQYDPDGTSALAGSSTRRGRSFRARSRPRTGAPSRCTPRPGSTCWAPVTRSRSSPRAAGRATSCRCWSPRSATTPQGTPARVSRACPPTTRSPATTNWTRTG